MLLFFNNYLKIAQKAKNFNSQHSSTLNLDIRVDLKKLLSPAQGEAFIINFKQVKRNKWHRCDNIRPNPTWYLASLLMRGAKNTLWGRNGTSNGYLTGGRCNSPVDLHPNGHVHSGLITLSLPCPRILRVGVRCYLSGLGP